MLRKKFIHNATTNGIANRQQFVEEYLLNLHSQIRFVEVYTLSVHSQILRSTNCKMM